MTARGAEEGAHRIDAQSQRRYNVFLSYSHQSDGQLASEIQRGLQRFAKPLLRWRATRVFRDETDLTAGPHLWDAVRARLDESAHFVLMASPEAASSKWVRKELVYWLSGGRCDEPKEFRARDAVYERVSRTLVVLCAGTIAWDDAARDFDWRATTALPDLFRGVTGGEPLWVDLTGYRGRRTSEFRGDERLHHALARILGPIRGMPADELLGLDRAAHRRTLRVAVTMLATLTGLLIATVWFGWRVLQQKQTLVVQEWSRRLEIARGLYRLSYEYTDEHDFQGAGACLLRALEVAPQNLVPSAFAASPSQSDWASAAWTRLKYLQLAPRIELPGHLVAVNRVVFARSGGVALSSSGFEHLYGPALDNTVRVWDTTTWRELRRFDLHSRGVNGLAVSSDGRLALSGSTHMAVDATGVAFLCHAILWEVDTLRVVHEFDGGDVPLRYGGTLHPAMVAFSPDNVFVLVGSVLYDVTSGKELRHLSTNEIVSVSNDFTVGVAGSHVLRTLDLKTGVEVGTYDGHSYSVWAVALSPDGSRALSGSVGLDSRDVDYSVRLWEVPRGVETLRLRGHQAHVTSVAFSPDGRMGASGSEDRTVRLWDLATGAELRKMEGHASGVRSVAFSPDGRSILSGASDGSLIVWNIANILPWTPPKVHEAIVETVAISTDGRTALSAGGTSDTTDGVVVWDFLESKATARLLGHDAFVHQVALTPDGHRAVSASWDDTVRVWDLSSGTELGKVPGTFRWPRFCLSPEGKFVVTSGPMAKLWELSSLNLIRNLGRGDQVAFAQNSERVALTGKDHVVVRDSSTGLECGRVSGYDPGIMIECLAFSPASDRLVVGWSGQLGTENATDKEGGLKLFNLSSGELIRSFGAGIGEINGIAFVPGEDVLVSTSRNLVCVWDIDTGEALNIFGGAGAEITSVAVGPSGRAITGSRDGVVRMYQLFDPSFPMKPPSVHPDAEDPYGEFESLYGTVGKRFSREDGSGTIELFPRRPDLTFAQLSKDLQDGDVYVRLRAAVRLGMDPHGAERELDLAAAGLKDVDARMRQQCLIAIGRLGAKAATATSAVAELLEDSDYYVRCEAADALGAIGEGASAAVPGLMRALTVDDYVNSDRFLESLSRHAADALGRIGAPAEAAVPELVRVFRRGGLGSWEAGEALAAIGRGAQAVQSDLVELLEHADVNVRASAARALAAIGDPDSVIDAVQRALEREQDMAVRAEMASILDQLRSDR